MVGTYEALLWLCEWNSGEQRGKRAKGEQTGSLNRVFFKDWGPFSRIRGLFRDSGPFRGFRAFFGDSRPFSGIRGLFADSRPFCRFAAFSRIHGLFTDSQPFRGFTAFSQIRGLFEDSRPFRGFLAFSQICGLFPDLRIHSQGSEGSERATWRNFHYLILLEGGGNCPHTFLPPNTDSVDVVVGTEH